MDVCSHQAIGVAPPVVVRHDPAQLLHELSSIIGLAEELLITTRQCGHVMH
jgi:hypothetical protein